MRFNSDSVDSNGKRPQDEDVDDDADSRDLIADGHNNYNKRFHKLLTQ